MIIEALDKISRKEFKSMLKNVNGVMLKTRNIKGYSEPKNVEVVYVCLSLETMINAKAEVKSALAELRTGNFICYRAFTLKEQSQ